MQIIIFLSPKKKKCFLLGRFTGIKTIKSYKKNIHSQTIFIEGLADTLE